MRVEGQVGPQVVSDGSFNEFRLGKTAEQVVQELHGRFYEQAYRGNLYSNGSTLTALSANTITLTATTTPILGVWNPGNSAVNMVILQAVLQVLANSASPVAQGGFVWATSTGNNVISTGTAPLNRKALTQAGSQGKGMSLVALTGLTNNLVVQAGAAITGLALSATTIAAATPVPGQVYVENLDGSIIIPPGGVLALLNTVSTTTVSVAGNLIWEEVLV